MEAVIVRFHADELAVDVLTADLRHRRERVGRDAPPTADLHVDAALNRFAAEIATPLHREDDDVNRVLAPLNAERTRAAKCQRAHVAGVMSVAADQIDNRVVDVVLVEGHRHLGDLRGIEQAARVGFEPEYRRTLPGRVGANALKDARPIVQGVRRDVNSRLFPTNKLPISPNPFRRHCLRSSRLFRQ